MKKLSVRTKATTLVLVGVSSTLIIASVGAHGAQQGSRADWLAATATLAALLAASVAAYFAYLALAHERERDERAVAELVAAWPEPVGFTDHDEVCCIDIMLLNASPVPVSEVKATVLLRLTDGTPDGEQTPFGRAETPTVLPPSPEPQRLTVCTSTPRARTEFVGVTRLPANRVDIDLRFRDSAGTPWQRRPPAALRRLSEEEWRALNEQDLPLVNPPSTPLRRSCECASWRTVSGSAAPAPGLPPRA